MQDDKFEWDDTNYAKHGVSFDHARLAFADVFAVSEIDDRFNYDEERSIVTGMVAGTLLFVAFTERGDRVRIIMARRATKHEQDDYYQQNSQDP
jgi:uncharacterized protein